MTGAPKQADQHILLICSVGGSPEPVVAAIRHWRPARTLFLCSIETRPSIDGVLDSAAAAGGPTLSPGSTDHVVIADPQDLQHTLRDLRSLDQHVRSWRERGDDYAVVVDFTGGTKVMSAALALVARRWPCIFTYVGGQERNKNGVGVVVSGREKQFSQLNPWNTLGYQTVEDAVTAFNHGGYAAAAALLDSTLKSADDSAVKRELATLKAVIGGYAAWDRFDHQTARTQFDNALRNRNDLTAMFPHGASPLIARLQRHRDLAGALAGQTNPSIEWVTDLLHNARRRAAEGRHDDAVARLYRAFEARAQVRLREQYGIPETKSVPLERLPETLRGEWAARAQVRAVPMHIGMRERPSPDAPRDESPGPDPVKSVMLGLQDAYRLLLELGDELGRKFAEHGLSDREKSPLVARNQSILAHGFAPVGPKVYEDLHRMLCSLLISPADAVGDDWDLPAVR